MRVQLWLGLWLVGACSLPFTPPTTSPGGCEGSEGPIEVGGDIRADTEWRCTEQPYRVTSDVRVGSGATLTVGPGVTVEHEPGVGIYVGTLDTGNLVADGAGSPIRFTSASPAPAPGDWVGLVIGAQARTAVLDRVLVQHAGLAGAEDAPHGAVVAHGAVEITGCSFRSNRGAGVWLAEGVRPIMFGANGFAGNDQAMVVDAAAVGDLGGANTFDSPEVVEVRGGVVPESGTWAIRGAPLRVTGDLRVEGNPLPAILTIGAGVRLEMAPEASVVVGGEGNGGIVVQGNASDPVWFTSSMSEPGPGAWEGVVLDANTVEASFEHAVVQFAGDRTEDGSYAVEAGLSVLGGVRASILNSSFLDNLATGVLFTGGGRAGAFHDNTFANNDGPGVMVHADAVASLGGPNAFAAGQVVWVTGGVVEQSGTWSPLGAPYEVAGDVYIEGPAAPRITIAPGVELRMHPGRGISVGTGGPGALVADAEGAAAILFTSAAPSPAPGDWEGVVLDAAAFEGTFRNVWFEFGGAPSRDASIDTHAALTAFRSQITVTGTLFSNNQTTAIELVDGASALEFRDNSFGGSGMRVSPNAVGTLSGPNTFEPGEHVVVSGGTVRDSAEWPDLGAPYVLEGTVRVEGEGAPLLQIAPGATLEMAVGVALIVGQGAPGSLVADAAKGSITVTSASPSPVPGDWSGIVFDRYTASGTLSGVELSNCGDPTLEPSLPVSGCVGVIDSAPNIAGCSFVGSSTNGIHVLGSGAPLLDANIFTNIAGSDVY